MGLSSMRRDPVLLLTAGLFLVLAVPLVVPVLPPEQHFLYSDTSTTLPFLAIAFVVYRWDLARAAPRTRRFWNLMSAAIGCWIGQQVVLLGSYLELIRGDTRLAEDLLYVGLYAGLVLALDVHPHERPGAGDRGALAALRRAGTVVFVFGMLAYLAMVPAALDPGSYRDAIPSFLLYGLLDGYLVLRVVGLLLDRPAEPWRSVYGWLLATFSLWLVLDAVEGLLWAEVLPWIAGTTAWDLPWFLPLLTLVAAGRVRDPRLEDGEAAETEEGPHRSAHLFLGGPLVLSAILVPLVHFSLYGLGLFGASTRRAHELTAFALLVVLGVLALSFQRILELRNRRLDLERREALARIEHEAYHDPLTDLPNRRLFWDRLGQAMANATRRGEPLAILFFDLDGFKSVNDSIGHSTGDELLRQVAARIVTSVRASDTVARLGGDEFVVIAPGVETGETAKRLARKIQRRLREPYQIADFELRVDASVGISRYPEDGEDLERLVSWADSAMYEAKAESPGTVRLAAAGGKAAEPRVLVPVTPEDEG